jgi:hypothetical protein
LGRIDRDALSRVTGFDRSAADKEYADDNDERKDNGQLFHDISPLYVFDYTHLQIMCQPCQGKKYNFLWNFVL